MEAVKVLDVSEDANGLAGDTARKEIVEEECIEVVAEEIESWRMRLGWSRRGVTKFELASKLSVFGDEGRAGGQCKGQRC